MIVTRKPPGMTPSWACQDLPLGGEGARRADEVFHGGSIHQVVYLVKSVIFQTISFYLTNDPASQSCPLEHLISHGLRRASFPSKGKLTPVHRFAVYRSRRGGR